VALDEYGGVAGVVTLDDILEALVGELPQQVSMHDLEIMRQPDGSWLVAGATAVDDLEVVMDLDPRTANYRRGARTLAGLVMSALGHPPHDRFDGRLMLFMLRDLHARALRRPPQ